MKKRIFTALLLSGILFFYQAVCALPEDISMVEGEVHTVKTVSAVSLSAKGAPEVEESRSHSLWSETVSLVPEEATDFSCRVSVFGIPCRTIRVSVKPASFLVAAGAPIGIKIYANGLMTVGFSDIGESCPALSAGMRMGDVISAVNGIAVENTAHFKELVQEAGGKSLRITLKRDETPMEITVIPTYEDGAYKIGAWVRDSIAGVGTLTCYDPDSMRFAALGHSISDFDTGESVEVARGSIVPCSIVAVDKSTPGHAGELCGQFQSDEDLGEIEANEDYGVTGKLFSADRVQGERVPVGVSTQIHIGEAVILTTAQGEQPKKYRANISKVLSLKGTKNMIVEVTDEELLKETGGIVQGMSGSPILQDGKLIGAVTHVFVDDPTRGYGISIENMMKK